MKPILISENPPPKDKDCLMNAGNYVEKDRRWIECFYVKTKLGGFWAAYNTTDAYPEHATHWLPVPKIDHDV
ncbi:MAG: hypothetical protein RL755_28 [Pseudomonadota bacterium]